MPQGYAEKIASRLSVFSSHLDETIPLYGVMYIMNLEAQHQGYYIEDNRYEKTT